MTRRWAVISDVHANLTALRAVLDDAERRGADAVLHLGDLVGYGGWPDETVRLATEVAAVGVAGNHDLIATGRLSDAKAGALAKETLRWTAGQLSGETARSLAELPTTAAHDGALLAHGSPDDPEEYVRNAHRARELLVEQLPGGADLLLLGHTHVPWAVSAERGVLLRDGTGRVELGQGPHLLNPGSVGQSRARSLAARYLLLDRAAGTADYIAVPYDVQTCKRRLAEVGLPPGTYRLRQPLYRRLVGRARRELLSRIDA